VNTYTNVLLLNDNRNEQSLSRKQNNKDSLMPNNLERRFGHPIMVDQYILFGSLLALCSSCGTAFTEEHVSVTSQTRAGEIF